MQKRRKVNVYYALNNTLNTFVMYAKDLNDNLWEYWESKFPVSTEISYHVEDMRHILSVHGYVIFNEIYDDSLDTL